MDNLVFKNIARAIKEVAFNLVSPHDAFKFNLRNFHALSREEKMPNIMQGFV